MWFFYILLFLCFSVSVYLSLCCCFQVCIFLLCSLDYQFQSFQHPDMVRAGCSGVDSGGIHTGVSQDICQVKDILMLLIISARKQVA